ncbi:MAG: leucine-rich repeat protein [Clostridia bacterium]|nr:leucine-rich repeat protein [Clostridia bacterium]
MTKIWLKNLIVVTIISILAFCIGACGDNSDDSNTNDNQTPSTISVESVELNINSVNLTIGGTKTLTATIKPSDASDKSVTWESSNTGVATVSNGIITAVALGESVIKVKTVDGNFVAECNVTVYDASNPDGALENEVFTFFNGKITGLTEYGKTLSEITITKSISEISADAFNGSQLLTKINVSEENQNYKSVEGNLYSFDLKTLYKFVDRSSTEVILPQTTEVIEKNAFYGNSYFTKISIPESVIEIKEKAFFGCKQIEEVIYDSSKEVSIGASAFAGCSQLKNIVMPSNATYGVSVFSGCPIINATIGVSGVKNVEKNYLKNITIIGEGDLVGGAFANCGLLESVQFEKGVTSIGNSAFSGCESLKTITLPETLLSIGERAFYKCEQIQNVNFNGLIDDWVEIEFLDYTSNPTYFSKDLYVSNTLLSDVVLTEATKISYNAFVNCKSIKSVTLPNTVVEIEGGAFKECTSLSTVVLSNALSKIGYYAFANCTSLKQIELPSSLTELKDGAFENCTSLMKVNSLGTIDNWAQIEFGNYSSNPIYYAKNLYINDVLVTDAVLTSATKISSYAFYNCDSVTSIVIPNSVTSIGEGAFENCTSLATITLGDQITYIGVNAFENTAYSNTSAKWIDGVLYIDNYLIGVLQDQEKVIVKKEVKYVAVSAFASLSSKTKILFNGVESEFDAIVIDQDNNVLSKAYIYFYSEQEPQLNEGKTAYVGNYWRYVEDVATVWFYEVPEE